MTPALLELPHMRGAVHAVDAQLKDLPDNIERAACAASFIVAAAIALRFYSSGSIVIDRLAALSEIIAGMDFDEQVRVMQ